MSESQSLSTEDMVCENCKYFKEHGIAGRDKDGECRRFPPCPSWPTVFTADWCGEFSVVLGEPRE